MQEKSPRLQAALAFAEQGIPIFPCLPNSKKPATEHGFHDATTDKGQIEAWWAEADYNVAFSPQDAGWGVIDPDGPEGMEAWRQLQIEHGQIETFTVRTPGGGRHYYFEGTLPTTSWRPGVKRALGTHIDTRGDGSYVLIPPSFVVDPVKYPQGGFYATEKNIDPAPVPAWAVARLAATSQRLEAATPDSATDSPFALARARAYLSDCVDRGDIAVRGQGSNNRTWQLGATLQNLHISLPQALELIEELWNPSCIPPWPSDKLEFVIGNGYRYAQNKPGAYDVAPLSSSFAAALDQLPPSEAKAPSNPFRFLRGHEQENMPDPEWLVDGVIPERSCVLLLGKSGSFKSFVAEDIALAVAAGQKTFGFQPRRTGRVFYAAGEGQWSIGKNRKLAWCKAKGVDPASIDTTFMVGPGPLVGQPELQELFRQAIRDELALDPTKIALILIDTTAEAMTGMDGSSDKDAGLFVHFCRQLVREFDCSVIAIHHYGKDTSQGSRGSSALPAGFDSRIEVDRADDTLGLAVRILHHKEFEVRREPFYFEGRKIDKGLVFDLVDQRQHAELASAADSFDHAKVAAALAHMGAIGYENGVATGALAREMVPWGANRTAEENEDTQNRTVRSLESLGRSKLKSYCSHTGRAYSWFIPASAAEGVLQHLEEKSPGSGS